MRGYYGVTSKGFSVSTKARFHGVCMSMILGFADNRKDLFLAVKESCGTC